MTTPNNHYLRLICPNLVKMCTIFCFFFSINLWCFCSTLIMVYPDLMPNSTLSCPVEFVRVYGTPFSRLGCRFWGFLVSQRLQCQIQVSCGSQRCLHYLRQPSDDEKVRVVVYSVHGRLLDVNANMTKTHFSFLWSLYLIIYSVDMWTSLLVRKKKCVMSEKRDDTNQSKQTHFLTSISSENLV